MSVRIVSSRALFYIFNLLRYYKAPVLQVEPPCLVGQTEEVLVYGVNSVDQLKDESVFT